MAKSSTSARKSSIKTRARGSVKAIDKRDRAVADDVALDEQSTAGRLVGRFAELGDQPPMRILSGATIAAAVIRRDRKLLRAGLRMLGAHSLATLAKAFVKDNVDRTRPSAASKGRDYRLKPGKSDDRGLQSMPSGHSAGVVAMAAAAISEYPAIATPAVAASAALIGAQLPSRNHYLSDVAVGSAIGLVAFALMHRLLPPLRTNARDGVA